MTIDGGGWTQMIQCLPSDGCKVGNVVLYNTDWLAQDYGTPSTFTSYAAGATLNPLMGSGHFMVEVTDTTTSKVGHLIYPVSADTRKFFSGTSFYESGPLAMTVIDSDGGAFGQTLRICWAPATSPYARSYQGASGLRFLGRSSATPTANANTACDYGLWESQMLIRNPSLSSLTTAWGTQPVSSWSVQPYAHRIYVREASAAVVPIVQAGAGRRWGDGTYARSCNGYRAPPPGARMYQGATGNGVYTIKPDPARAPVDVYCEMATDGGGWTLVQRTLWEWAASQALMTPFASFYDNNVGSPMSAWRLAGAHWKQVQEKNEMLVAHHARKASTGQSCQPLY
ncbi:MAG TPA: fibrinogen-like YCDxxxxGGGW domain-containing protein, partial [Armatimonadota bacterium]|nr:fibrinogen-like YCDxxxxGGGW domain-containing protein [Armatimonadota bacterium]